MIIVAKIRGENRKKIYYQLLAKEKSYRILNHYRKLILRQSYDSVMINLEIFRKSVIEAAILGQLR